MALTKIGYTLIKDNFKDSVSGSSTAHSASFSSRVTTAESELENTIVSSSAQISTDISGSLGANASTIRTLSSATVSGSRDATSISGSRDAASISGSRDAASISGSRDAASISGSRDAASISGSLGANATVIRNLSAPIISGSSVSSSNSVSARVVSLEGSGTIQGVGTTNNVLFGSITGSGNVSASGNLSATGNLDIDGTSNFTGNVTMQNDLVVTGRIDAEEIHTTFISSSIAQATGSNIFGDSINDSHQFTGSIDISGSGTVLRVSDGDVLVSDTFTVGGDIYGNARLYLGTKMALDMEGTQLYVGSTTSANDNSAIYFRTDDANRMVVSSSGEVGIGTDSPTGQLTIASSTVPTLTFKDTGGGTDSKIFRLAGGGDAFYFEGRNDADSGDGDAGTIMTFDLTNGRVGINATSPLAKLQVGSGSVLVTGTGEGYAFETGAAANTLEDYEEG